MKKTTLLLALILFVQLGFAQVAISVTTTGKGNPIIFLPGFTCPGSVWDETVKNLNGSYKSYMVSYAGFNGVQPVASPWYDTVKQQLKDYIKNQKLSKVTLIGHSMGGNLAMELAAELPERVAGLILVETIPCIREVMMPGVEASNIQYNSAHNNKLLAMSELDFKKMASQTARYMTNTEAKIATLTNWSAAADRKTYVYGYTDLLKLDLRDKVGDIKIHTLIVGASFPNGELVKSNYEKQYANLKDKQILIAEASKHFVMFDKPEWLYTQINKYIGQYAK